MSSGFRYPPCPVNDDHPERWRWILDGDRWVKLAPAAARRFRQETRYPFPAGEISIAAELPRMRELAELDALLDARYEAGKTRGSQKTRDAETRRLAIREIARERGIDLGGFEALSRKQQRNVVTMIEADLAARQMAVASRTVRADIRALQKVQFR